MEWRRGVSVEVFLAVGKMAKIMLERNKEKLENLMLINVFLFCLPKNILNTMF